MAAITWRSLMGQNPDPVRAMSAAQDSFNGMFSSLNSALTKYQNQQLEQENKLKSDNLEKFYADASSRYATPEAFQAALASGELQSLAGSYGDDIDKAAVRNFMETRGKVLQDRAQSQWAFDDKTRERNAAPIVDQVKSNIAAGKFDTVNKLLDEHELPNEAILYESLRSAQDKQDERSRADTRFGWEKNDREYLEGDRKVKLDGEAAADVMVEALLAHRANIASLGQAQGAAAKELGLPVTSNGLPDMEAISTNPAAKDAFNKLVAARGLQMPSDTEAFNTAVAVAQQSGIGGAQLLPLLSQGELFNTTQGNMLVGAEKATLERNLAQLEKEEKEIKEKNSLYLSSKNVVDQLPALNKQLKDAGVDDNKIRTVSRYVQQRLKDYPDEPLHIPALVAAAATTPTWWEEDRQSGIFGGLGTDFFNTEEGRFKRQMADLLDSEAFAKQKAEFELLKKQEARIARAREQAANSGKVPYR